MVKKILAVDGNQKNLNDYTPALANPNYDLASTSDPVAAMGLIRGESYDLLIMWYDERAGFGKSFLNEAHRIRPNMRLFNPSKKIKAETLTGIVKALIGN